MSLNSWSYEELGYVPDDIGAASWYGEGWNWGAFFCPGFWPFFHRAYLAGILYWLLFLLLMPLSWIVAVYLGVKGNSIALSRRNFSSAYDFESTQRAWKYGGGVFFGLFVLIQTLYFIVLMLVRWQVARY